MRTGHPAKIRRSLRTTTGARQNCGYRRTERPNPLAPFPAREGGMRANARWWLAFPSPPQRGARGEVVLRCGSGYFPHKFVVHPLGPAQRLFLQPCFGACYEPGGFRGERLRVVKVQTSGQRRDLRSSLNGPASTIGFPRNTQSNERGDKRYGSRRRQVV